MIRHWEAKAGQVLSDNTDVIVIPEYSYRFGDMEREKRLEYYKMKGARIAGKSSVRRGI